MDISRLRSILRDRVVALKDAVTHSMLPAVCEQLGLLGPDPEGSKRERLEAAFDALPDEALATLAERLLKLYPPPARMRNEIQDLLWDDLATPEIPKKNRRDLARALTVEEIYLHAQHFDELLARLWVLDDDADWLSELDGVGSSLRHEIERHVHRNPGDWSTESLFDRLGAFEASDRRFGLFLEGLASADVLPDEQAQRRLVATVNRTLGVCGVELIETHIEGGYPVFALVSTRTGKAKRPKNLIFASAVKPDLRLRDAVSNDIEIVTHADKVLVYDRPVSVDGIRWRDLQAWWSMEKQIADDEKAKRTLYRRLRDSLPENSPGQRLLFKTFHRTFGSAIPELPALLPEVWLHWDPKTVRERGPDALPRFRMDFLMLLPRGARVVLEVDGMHHYGSQDGRADAARYAEMAAADRELKLAGYEVFRFGAEELMSVNAQDIVRKFFEALFKQYSVYIPGTRTVTVSSSPLGAWRQDPPQQ